MPEMTNSDRVLTTSVSSRQPLIAPLDLGLPSVDDLTIRENLDAFTQNGFGFVEHLESGKLKLNSVPFSKGTTFGVDDIQEMVR